MVGATGGAGTSTLARHLDYVDHATTPPADTGQPMVVAASSTADATRALLELLEHLLPRDGRVVVAIVNDGLGGWPPAVRARARNLDGHVDAVVDVPYVPIWRYSGAANEPPTNDYRDAIRRISHLAAPPNYTGAAS
ncbi:hypothetical protein [Salsipaludibacter albus]|uniref:hypothetical protein n=1 Tax=Salsipaludibacter albus TaxID=2849650 RepID=UPI001EE3D41F|nr:hypothetical protein [Salsipaludibacter albus]MBY5163161.1 hypothetical protein [Salsipaludibacter albus]